MLEIGKALSFAASILSLYALMGMPDIWKRRFASTKPLFKIDSFSAQPLRLTPVDLFG